MTATTLADGVAAAMDDAGFADAHLVGNSLGGYVALQLAERGRDRGRRRRATEAITVSYEHLEPDLIAHMIRGAAGCTGLTDLIAHARAAGWPLNADRITVPVRIIWGTEDRLLGWPRAADRYRLEYLPHADWVVLDGIGHCPQLDVPLETAQLILGHTSA